MRSIKSVGPYRIIISVIHPVCSLTAACLCVRRIDTQTHTHELDRARWWCAGSIEALWLPPSSASGGLGRPWRSPQAGRPHGAVTKTSAGETALGCAPHTTLVGGWGVGASEVNKNNDERASDKTAAAKRLLEAEPARPICGHLNTELDRLGSINRYYGRGLVGIDQPGHDLVAGFETRWRASVGAGWGRWEPLLSDLRIFPLTTRKQRRGNDSLARSSHRLPAFFCMSSLPPKRGRAMLPLDLDQSNGSTVERNDGWMLLCCGSCHQPIHLAPRLPTTTAAAGRKAAAIDQQQQASMGGDDFYLRY